MPSSWPIYTYLVFAAALGTVISLALRMIPRVMAPVARSSLLGSRLYLRFFIGASTAVLLLVGAFLLLPMVTGLSTLSGDKKATALGATVPLVIFLAVGLFYAVKKGELAWKKELSTEKKPT